jgi:hypothetical protein
MGRKAISGGVTNFRGKCRVDFKYEGQRYQPVLDLEYNARNVRAAQKMMEIVRAKIAHGVFDPANISRTTQASSGWRSPAHVRAQRRSATMRSSGRRPSARKRLRLAKTIARA